MTAPKLLIRKRMLNIQGKVRPCCYVQAVVDPATQAALEKHFMNEALFRRAAYSSSWPAGALQIPSALAPSLSALLKNDACPEVTVKTLVAGQMMQAANAWEMMSFEFIAKVAFDNLVQLVVTVMEIDRDIFYAGSAAPAEILEGQPALPAEVAVAEHTAVAA